MINNGHTFATSATRPPDAAPAVLVLDRASKSFHAADRQTQALIDISLRLHTRRALAVVGESGSGKSTLARIAAAALLPDSGTVTIDGINPSDLSAADLRRFRTRVQLIHQHSAAALDPTMRVDEAITEGLRIHPPLDAPRFGRRRAMYFEQRAAELAALVGLPGDVLHRLPSELSGGQRQRVSIARALAIAPAVLVADEPLASLDTATAARILDLLADLQNRLGLACLFVTHDLAAARYFAESIAVLHRGVLVETGPTAPLFSSPRHPYTRELLAAAYTL